MQTVGIASWFAKPGDTQVCYDHNIQSHSQSLKSMILVYLSAQVILSREFSGDRLARVYAPLKGSQSLAHTNVWSYLRQRLDERQSRRTAYEKSFLARIIQVLSKGKANFVDYPIHRILWTSPDCDLQTTIALRSVKSLGT